MLGAKMEGSLSFLASPVRNSLYLYFAYLVKDLFLFVKMFFVINGLCKKLVILGQKYSHVTHEVLPVLLQGTIDLA